MKIMKIKYHRSVFIAMYIIPAFFLYFFCLLLPNIVAVLLSFANWNGFTMDIKLVGFVNYLKLVHDPLILKAFLNNMYFAFFSMIFTISFAMFFAAILCNKSVKEGAVYKAIYFLPNVMSVVVVSILWKFIYSPSFGLINGVLNAVGLESLIKVWLGDVNTVKLALLIPQIWTNIGFYMIIYIAAITNITKDIYEAATIDGATKIRQFFKITFPLLWNLIKITMVYFMAGALNYGFALIKIMTDGGPNNESIVLTTYLYQKAFQGSEFGYGAAIGTLILFLGFGFYLFTEKALKSENYEY